MNKLLARQLKKRGLNLDDLPKDLSQWQEFLKSIEDTYQLNDEDRYLLERSIELSSKEMREEVERNREMSVQLAQAGKLASLGTMASGIAHELNNPLAGIKGYAELLALTSDMSQDELESINSIIKLSDRMAGIIKHLLKLSRQSQDRTEAKPIDIRDPMSDVFELLKRQMNTDNIFLEIKEKATNYRVLSNVSNLASVFQNLITNSRDAFLQNSSLSQLHIQIEYSNDGDEIVVLYQDTAGGMDDETLEKIFDPFYSTKEVGKGTGLGMAITKQLIEENEGSIQVRNLKGIGTEFEIRLPSFNAKSMSHKKDNIASLNFSPWKALPTQRHSVLVIDDEMVICNLMKQVLNECFAVETTTSPEKGIDLLNQNSYDLIVTDVKMPKISGTEVAHQLRQSNSNTPLVFISGHIDGDLNGDLKPYAPYLLIEKPLPSPRKLIELLTDQIESSTDLAA